ncbi:MAG: hypothetical protein MZW92_78505 [Comamonadaceae bacterium]|nr:hypothetical protein [Comamonadaceae bacterium]
MLGQRLRRDHGFDVRTFSYPTLHGDAAEICAELAEFADSVGGRRARPLRGPQPRRRAGATAR